MRKKENFKAVLAIIIATEILLFCCGCSDPNNDAKENDEEIVLENGLTLNEAKEYGMFYKLGCNKAILYLEQMEDEIDDIEFCSLVNTEMLVALFNYRIWDDESPYDDYKKAMEICKEYRLDNENRLTSQWILENPVDAYALQSKLPEQVNYWLRVETEKKFFKHIVGLIQPSPKGELNDHNDIVLKNGLTLEENKAYALFFKLGCDMDLIYLNEANDIEYYANEATERLVYIFNYYLWDYNPTLDRDKEVLEEIRQVCKKYGFDDSNRLNIQWILEKPLDAYNMINEFPAWDYYMIGYDLYRYFRIRSI